MFFSKNECCKTSKLHFPALWNIIKDKLYIYYFIYSEKIYLLKEAVYTC